MHPGVGRPPTVLTDGRMDVDILRVRKKGVVGRAEEDYTGCLQGPGDVDQPRISVNVQRRSFQDPSRFAQRSGVE